MEPNKDIKDENKALTIEDIAVFCKKKGFVFPWENWMKGPLRSFCEEELSRLKDLPIFEALGLEENWNRFVQGDNKMPWNYFWHLVVLSHWINKNNVRFSYDIDFYRLVYPGFQSRRANSIYIQLGAAARPPSVGSYR
jgi:hypothetical protein